MTLFAPVNRFEERTTMFIIFLVSITVLFISAANTGSPSVNWKNETFYVVDPDCYFISAASISAIQEGINNYSPASSNRLCENVSSTVYRNPKGNHIIFVRYESLKEISIAIQQTNGSTNFNLKDLFVKVNYEYILGDYCNFDKTLLSIGVDSNMSYITVKCGNDEWAFMRSVLTPTGEFYTPFGPLIFFQKGDPSFNRLSFLSLYDENDNNNIFHDSVVLRYAIKKDSASEITYLASYLHDLNNTQNNVIGSKGVASSMNIFFSTMLAEFIVAAGPSNNQAEIKNYVYNSSNILNMSKLLDLYVNVNVNVNGTIIVNKDPTFIQIFGCCLNVQTEQPFEAINWKIRDTERIVNFKNEECPLEYEKEEKEKVCEPEEKKSTSVFIALYFVAGAELILFIATLIALIIIIVLRKKKSKNDSSKKEANVTLLGYPSSIK